MFWSNWFKREPQITEQEALANALKGITLDNLTMAAGTDGGLLLSFGGKFTVTVPGNLRHAFLEKMQSAVHMADIADPHNEPLNKVLH